jgi:hypothetical protein
MRNHNGSRFKMLCFYFDLNSLNFAIVMIILSQ